MGPLIPLFWTSGDVCPGLQNQGESLVCLLTCVILRFTSGATPADCIEVSMAAKPFPSGFSLGFQLLYEITKLKHKTTRSEDFDNLVPGVSHEAQFYFQERHFEIPLNTNWTKRKGKQKSKH